MEWAEAKDLALKFISAGAVYLLVNEIHNFRQAVKDLIRVIAQQSDHERRIASLEEDRKRR